MVSVSAAAAGEAWVCEVEVDHGGEHTRHTVTVSPRDLARWGTGDHKEDVEDLVARSFDFLLEREPPGSILQRFDLSVIQRYFADYDQQFRR